MRKLGKKSILLLVAAAVFVLYLLLANTIMMQALPESQRIRSASLTGIQTLGDTYGGCDSIIYSGGLTEQLSISGWCFSENTADNANKYAQIYLVSDKHTYLVPRVENSMRRDIEKKMGKSYDIVGMNHGYAATFATFSMPSGIYEIYIYNWENETAHGLFKTSYRVQKTGGEVSVLETRTVDNFTGAVEQEAVNFRLDTFTRDEGGFTLSGWGMLTGYNPDDTAYYLEMTNGAGGVTTTELITYSRPGIARLFDDGNISYLNTGLKATLPLTALTPGMYHMRVLTVYNKEVFVSANSITYLLREDNTIARVEKDNPKWSDALAEPVAQATIAEAEANDGFILEMEQGYISGDFIFLQGWAASPNLPESERLERAYVQVTTPDGQTQLYAAALYLRDGLAERVGQATAQEFCAQLPLTELTQGDFEIRLFFGSSTALYAHPTVYPYHIDSGAILQGPLDAKVQNDPQGASE